MVCISAVFQDVSIRGVFNHIFTNPFNKSCVCRSLSIFNFGQQKLILLYFSCLVICLLSWSGIKFVSCYVFFLQISDAVKFSQILLKHGTNAEILSLKRLIQSQLNRVVNQKTGTIFIAAVENAIRNASWDMWVERLTREKQSNGLTLPEVHDSFESDDDDGKIFELIIHTTSILLFFSPFFLNFI